jgi:hypothetical protein
MKGQIFIQNNYVKLILSIITIEFLHASYIRLVIFLYILFKYYYFFIFYKDYIFPKYYIFLLLKKKKKKKMWREK